MKIPIATFVLICIAPAPAAAAAAADVPAVVEAKAFIEYGLKDPASVQWRGVLSYPDGVTCGEYNAKNSYGGYTGFSWFVYSKEQYRFMSTDATPADVRVLCANPSPRKFAMHALWPVIQELTDLTYKCRDQINRPAGQDYCKAGYDLVAKYKAEWPGTFDPKFNP